MTSVPGNMMSEKTFHRTMRVRLIRVVTTPWLTFHVVARVTVTEARMWSRGSGESPGTTSATNVPAGRDPGQDSATRRRLPRGEPVLGVTAVSGPRTFHDVARTTMTAVRTFHVVGRVRATTVRTFHVVDRVIETEVVEVASTRVTSMP